MSPFREAGCLAVQVARRLVFPVAVSGVGTRDQRLCLQILQIGRIDRITRAALQGLKIGDDALVRLPDRTVPKESDWCRIDIIRPDPSVLCRDNFAGSEIRQHAVDAIGPGMPAHGFDGSWPSNG